MVAILPLPISLLQSTSVEPTDRDVTPRDVRHTFWWPETIWLRNTSSFESKFQE